VTRHKIGTPGAVDPTEDVGAERSYLRAKILGNENSLAQNHWFGVVGSTWWFYYTGESTDLVWTSFVEHSRQMLDAGHARPAFLSIAHRAAPPSAEQRRLLVEFLATERDRFGTLVGSALVIDSPLHLLALNAINWVVKKPFAEMVCGSPSAAATWLAEQGAILSELDLRQCLARAIPIEHLWRDW
jgi:hypothetical protein